MGKTEFHGHEGIEGIEFRYDEDGDLDEVLVYVQTKCVVHIERMHDTCFWMGMYTDKIEGSVNFRSVSGRAAVELGTAEAWKKYDDSKLSTLLECRGLLKAQPNP